jgi:hypothetical protein
VRVRPWASVSTHRSARRARTPLGVRVDCLVMSHALSSVLVVQPSTFSPNRCSAGMRSHNMCLSDSTAFTARRAFTGVISNSNFDSGMSPTSRPWPSMTSSGESCSGLACANRFRIFDNQRNVAQGSASGEY